MMIENRLFYIIFWLCFLLSPTLLIAQEADIQITNLSSGETVGYELLLIKGIPSENTKEVTVSSAGQVSSWPAAGGKFKVLTYLKKGSNELLLQAKDHKDKTLTINYEPIKSKKFARLVYIIPSDHEENGNDCFMAPEGEANDIESAKKRLRLAGLMLQTA
ncbi:hypothetical protein KA005_20370, partial [bacterium]|nr:hypothetical protein [bacterium]